MKVAAAVGHKASSIALRLVAVVCIGILLVIGIGPRTGRYKTMTVLSGSMQPGIPVGAVVITTPEPARQLRVGQVIAYQIPVEDHRVVSHRVVRIVKGGDRPVFQTKGDANNAPDNWTAQVNGGTVWVVRSVVPQAGLAIHWLHQPSVRTVSVLVMPALLALVWLAAIWRGGEDGADPVGSAVEQTAATAGGTPSLGAALRGLADLAVTRTPGRLPPYLAFAAQMAGGKRLSHGGLGAAAGLGAAGGWKRSGADRR